MKSNQIISNYGCYSAVSALEAQIEKLERIFWLWVTSL